MKAVTRVRFAVRLMAHVEDLSGLRQFTAQELPLIQEALLLFIHHIQQESAPPQAALPVSRLLSTPKKTYVFQPRNSAPDRLIIHEEGQPERRLQHVPIFSYGFGLAGLPALDLALAILADVFDEPLSLRAFAAGEGHSWQMYRAFAREVLAHPRAQGHFEMKRIVTFLRRWEEQQVRSSALSANPSNGNLKLPPHDEGKEQ